MWGLREGLSGFVESLGMGVLGSCLRVSGSRFTVVGLGLVRV